MCEDGTMNQQDMLLVLQQWAGTDDPKKAVAKLLPSRATEVSIRKLTVSAATKEYLSTHRFKSDETRDTYARVLRNLCELCGHEPLTSLSTAKVTAFLFRPRAEKADKSKRSEAEGQDSQNEDKKLPTQGQDPQQETKPPRSGNTINKERSAVSALCTWAVKNRCLETNPVSLIDEAEVAPGRPVALPPPEQAKFLDLSRKSKRLRLRNCALANLFLYAGPRAIEVARLKWGDVDFDQKLVQFLGKRNKRRTLPLLPPAGEALLAYREEQKARGASLDSDAPVFVNSQGQSAGGPMTQSGLRALFKPVFQKLGKPTGQSLHSLRHTFAVNLLWIGVEPFLIQHSLGHAYIDTTLTYLRLADAEVVRELNARFSLMDLKTLNPERLNDWAAGVKALNPLLATDKEE